MPHAHTDCPFLDFASADGVHALQLYERDAHLVDAIARLVGCGLAGGDGVVVIATAAHREALRAVLDARSIDWLGAGRDGRYVEADAAAVLAQLCVGGPPDRRRFFDVVGGLLRGIRERAVAAGGGGGVRAFGEMVALLWAAGGRAGALALEGFWNEIATTMPLTLLCAYPAVGFAQDASAAGLRDVCLQHRAIIPTGAGSDAVPSPDLLAETRGERWNAQLADWGALAEGLAPDARDRLLHAAQMVANALRQGPTRRR